ncbi:hypothetical protein BD770DRAFT_454248, partial [Pilaira anomala]
PNCKQCLRHSGNKEAYDGILEVLCRTDYFKAKMCDTNGNLFKDKEPYFKLICREVYYGLKKKERFLALPLDVIAAENAVKSFKARKTRKFTKRKEIFSSCTDTVTNRMQKSAEECRRFLMKDCMSDEENDTIDPNTGDAISFKVIVPEWRSDKLNEFYTVLDELHANRSTRYKLSKKRTYHSGPMDVPDKVIKKRLPGWGFRQS